MLTVSIPESEFYNESTGEFIEVRPRTIQMEHSLISVSKWESKWKKPFFDGKPKTRAETIDYYKCMTVTPNVDPTLYLGITPEIEKKILSYINEPQTATTIHKRNGGHGKSETLTSELIYYQMSAQNIPFECERWHMSRLFMLLEIAAIKSNPTKKMSKKDIYSQNRALNAARRATSGSAG